MKIWILVPVALAAFALIDMLNGKKIAWAKNVTVVIVVLLIQSLMKK